MIVFKVWTEFKPFILDKSRLRWVDREAFYYLRYNDFESTIEKNSGADQTDFETNFKTSANSYAPNLFISSPFAASEGFRARLKGFSGTIAAGATGNVQYKLIEERWINGIEVVLKNQVAGDKVNFEVVDVDNILGYGAGVVLDRFAEDWHVSSDQGRHGPYVLNYPAKIIANLYIRVGYVSTGAQDVSVYVNAFLHKRT